MGLVRVATVAWLLAAGILAAGCVNLLEPEACGAPGLVPLVTSAAAHAPSPPLTVDLVVCNPEAFFEGGSRVVLKVHAPFADGPHVTAGITLPPGVDLVAGSVSYEGELPYGENDHHLVSVLRARTSGEYVLRGWGDVTSWAVAGSRAAPTDHVGVRGGPGAAEVFGLTCLRNTNPACEAPQISITVSATAENRSTVTGHLTASEFVSGRAMFWTGAKQDPAEWVGNVTLSPHAATTLTTTVVLPEEWAESGSGGYYGVTLYFYPHAGQDTEVYEDSVYYQVVDDEITVHHERPST